MNRKSLASLGRSAALLVGGAACSGDDDDADTDDVDVTVGDMGGTDDQGTTGSSEGMIISLMAAPVSMSTAVPYSGLAVPSMMPGMVRNCRRTSSTTLPAARPTASIAIAPNR